MTNDTQVEDMLSNGNSDPAARLNHHRNFLENKSHVQLRDEDMEGIIDPQEVRDSFQKHVDRLKDDYVKHLSLRSSAGAVENLQVELEGSKYALQELAQIGRKSPQVLMINMSSFPQAIPSVMNALQHSGMNLNPQQEASMIYVPIPKVTKEHRESLAKNAKVLFNKCKDHIKDVQNNHIRHVKKQEQEISTDTSFAIQQQIHEWAESYTSQADKLMTAKQQELLGTS
nr:EOG090X0DUK [Triops cancriformis]